MDRSLKRIFFDIETTGLKADWDHVLCISYKVEGEPIRTLKVGAPYYDDREVIKKFARVLARPDVGLLVGHNSKKFDLPFLNARALHHGLPRLPLIAHLDTLEVARQHLAVSSRRLGNLAEFTHVRFRKTPLSPVTWQRARRGDKLALERVVRHCESDIRVLESVYRKLSPLIIRHPTLTPTTEPCHNCNSPSLISRGYYTTRTTGRQQRLSCTKCGAWTHRAIKE